MPRPGRIRALYDKFMELIRSSPLFRWVTFAALLLTCSATVGSYLWGPHILTATVYDHTPNALTYQSGDSEKQVAGYGRLKATAITFQNREFMTNTAGKLRVYVYTTTFIPMYMDGEITTYIKRPECPRFHKRTLTLDRTSFTLNNPTVKIEPCRTPTDPSESATLETNHASNYRAVSLARAGDQNAANRLFIRAVRPGDSFGDANNVTIQFSGENFVREITVPVPRTGLGIFYPQQNDALVEVPNPPEQISFTTTSAFGFFGSSKTFEVHNKNKAGDMIEVKHHDGTKLLARVLGPTDAFIYLKSDLMKKIESLKKGLLNVGVRPVIVGSEVSPELSTNSIWIGHKVDISTAQDVVELIHDHGISIKKIVRKNLDTGGPNQIQIGTDKQLVDARNISGEEIETFVQSRSEKASMLLKNENLVSDGKP